ncbi:patatin-like phospholipase family protein [Pararoseomonas sp. SCSIO 73927]|uniref:patatin-like phospholipase family protein n=1 Tax=Pararoseomonas sp. SCSIO 73927 TaxID=3114537 RepID=UPI0030CF0248
MSGTADGKDGKEGLPPIEGTPAAPALSRPAEPHRISLALQGGGSHGAFTWGVLLRLLEEESVEVAAISGSSAGALNGAAFTQGYAQGGRDGAKALLDRLWTAIGARYAFSPLRNTPLEQLVWGPDLSHGLAWQAFDTLTRFFSPYQLNPFPIEMNPLRRVLEEVLDLEVLCHHPEAPRLHVTATNVRSGKPRVFSRQEVTREALLASACLPNLFRAVEIEGEAYWDGGFMGNPALWPLYERPGSPQDIVLIGINPISRPDIPRTVQEIETRVNEISFNASLMYEMRAIEFVQRLVDQGVLVPPRYQRLYVHVIEDEEKMRRFGMTSKYNGDWNFLSALREDGRAAAEAWLAEHRGALGRRDSVDLRARFL